MNLPNKLTVGRVIAVPFFIAAYLMGYYTAAQVIFICAALTDALDGKIARSRNLVTNFGKIMDPLADKILVYSALCLFIESDIIKAWMLIIILAREFVVAGMRTASNRAASRCSPQASPAFGSRQRADSSLGSQSAACGP